MGNYGVKIAKAGYDYDDGDRYLIYNSAYPLLKMKAHGEGSITLSSGSWSGTIYTHNLGYKPMFYFFIEYLNIEAGDHLAERRMCSWREYYGVGVWSRYNAWTTTTTLELNVYTAYATNDVLHFNWVLFYDPIA